MNPMEFFVREAPEAAGAFDGLVAALCARADGMDGKSRQLAYIAMRASRGEAAAVVAHAPMARAEGATRGEVRDAVLMSLAVSGISGVLSCLGPALDAYDAAARKPGGETRP